MPNIKDYSDSVLNDLEKIQLQKFADNEEMAKVVKKILLAGIYQNGTLKAGKDPKPEYNCAFGYLQFADGHNTEVTDAQVGANIRALYEGLKAVEYAFQLVELYKTPEEPENKKTNNAR